MVSPDTDGGTAPGSRGRIRWRLFLTAWILLSLHFATNVVREHYPALTLIDEGHFQLDTYAGFHADIFEHRDGHHYIGNQVAGAAVAAIPLLVFKPLLDYLADVGARRAAQAADSGSGGYETEYPNRAKFFAKVRARGLDLKLGATAAITAVFLMTPLCALLGVVVYEILRRRSATRARAQWLALLFVFGTPVFYRSASLNHNLMFCAAMFGAFLCLWPDLWGGPAGPRRRLVAGLLAASTVALDYAGVVTGPAIFVYMLVTHRGFGGLKPAVKGSLPFVIGCIPPFLFLWATQWWMYGHPFLPGQAWMPVQNEFVQEGARGLTLPDPEVFWLNLFSLDWGLYTFGPLLLIGLWPSRWYPAQTLALPRRERRFAAAFMLAFMLFCACNQYSRLQWNTGFRYLLPLVPFAFLAASDHLARMPTAVLGVVTTLAVAHSWVLSMFRYTPPSRHPGAPDYPSAIPESWSRFFEEGLQFPWLTVLRSTPSISFPGMREAWFPYALLALALGAVAVVWRLTAPKPRSA